MNTDEILSAIDAEIDKLQQVRAVLSGYSEPMVLKRGPGRPKKLVAAPSEGRRRTISAEGSARIAAAQRKRWAAAKKLSK